MPYIAQYRRAELLAKDPTPLAPGEVNYFISGLCNAYIESHGKSYDTLNALIGALECAKLELYRRIAAPYEDEKIIENGDVYDSQD